MHIFMHEYLEKDYLMYWTGFKFKLPLFPTTAASVHPAHPSSFDSSSDEATEQRIEKEDTTADFGASIVIGAQLVVPVLVIVIIVVFLRVRKQRKCTTNIVL